MLFDDYGFATCPGARRAIDEFFADKPEPIIDYRRAKPLSQSKKWPKKCKWGHGHSREKACEENSRRSSTRHPGAGWGPSRRSTDPVIVGARHCNCLKSPE